MLDIDELKSEAKAAYHAANIYVLCIPPVLAFTQNSAVQIVALTTLLCLTLIEVRRQHKLNRRIQASQGPEPSHDHKAHRHSPPDHRP